MYPNYDDSLEYRDYGSKSNEIDYSNPDYYQSSPARPNTEVPAYEQPQAAYPHGEQAFAEYRGPGELAQYAADGSKSDGVETRTDGAGQQRSGARGGLAGLGSAIIALGAVFLKFGIAGVSALVSIVVYSALFGWRFAIGLVALLFIHEMGHALVMKLKGIPVGGMIFIPMLGAAVTMRQMPGNAKDEAEVGIAGPIAGTMASAVCLLIAQMTPGESTVWAPLAYLGFFMNLFNLVPIVPFDGGRVLAAIDRRIWILGFLGLLGFLIWTWINGEFSPWLLFFVFMAASQLWSRRGSNDPQERAYYDVPTGSRIILSLLYFGLIAVLVLGMAQAHALIPGMG